MFKKMGETTRFVIVICGFLILLDALLGAALIRQSAKAMRTQIESRMLDISNTAAAMLDGDALARVTADATTPEYQSVYNTLLYYQDNMDLAYIYCLRQVGDGEFVFTVDPSDDPAEFGERIVTTDELIRASKGIPSVDKDPYQDRWGKFYSAYSPVYDSGYKMAGLVAVDFSAPWYEQQIRQQVLTMLMISVVSLVMAGIVIALIVTRFRERFRHMLSEMNIVTEGIETLVHEIAPRAEMPRRAADEARSGDEITELGDRIQLLEKELGDQIAFVRSQAFVDGLTGLGNRVAYEEYVKRLDDGIKERWASFTLALFDMNGLKEINDKLGHARGDQAIASVAAELRRAFGDAALYRIGGDEFVAVKEAPPADVQAIAADVNRVLEAEGFSVAKGIAAYEPENDLGYREVFNRADAAMYADKREYYREHEDRHYRMTHGD